MTFDRGPKLINATFRDSILIIINAMIFNKLFGKYAAGVSLNYLLLLEYKSTT